MNRDALVRSRRSKLPLFALLVAALCAGLGLAGCAGSPDAPTPAPTTSEMSSGVLPYEVVEFDTDDGLTLSGRLYGEGVRAVLLSHMYPADQTSWHSEAARLESEGYMVLTYDFRGYGLSQGNKDIASLDRDVSAGIRYLRGAGAREIVLAGASMGGTASIVAAAEAQALSSVRVAGVATFSAPVEFQGLSARDAVPDIQIAMLFIAAEDDVGADGARQLQALAGDRGELHILPGGDHGTDLFAGDQSDATSQLLLDFVRLCMPVGG